MLPGFLCIGAQKAGTSWLFVQLQQHPQVWMPPVKELHYFDHLYVPENRKWTKWHVVGGASRALKWHVNNVKNPDFDYVRYLTDLASKDLFTEAWYERAFERPAAKGKLLGDITPEYSTISEEGISHVRRLLAGVKIIYIIRDPVDRALSQVRMNLQRRGLATPQETDWLAAIDEWDIRNRGDYKTYVPRWRSAFAAGDLLFVNYRDITSRPVELMTEMEQFLGIDRHKDYSGLTRKVHETKAMVVPATVRSRLEESLWAQVEFVRSEFGPGFLVRNSIRMQEQPSV